MCSKCQDCLCPGGHHFHNATPPEVVRDVLTAGMDNDCGNMVSPNHTKAALAAGLITAQLIDTRVGNLFKVRMRLGLFDSTLGPLHKITNDTAAPCSPYAYALGREGVAQSAALLKNVQNTLPLDAKALKSVAVIGPMIGDEVTSGASQYLINFG